MQETIPEGVKSSFEWETTAFRHSTAMHDTPSRLKPSMQRNWLRQHCAADSVDVRGQFTCGGTCYDIWLCTDREGDASDDKCKPSIS
eukprot:5921452-Pyramimonas_sp.AAC.1